MSEVNLLGVRVHEAGHAFLGVVLDLDVAETCASTDDATCKVHLPKSALAALANLKERLDAGALKGGDYVESAITTWRPMAMVLLAGQIAETLVTGNGLLAARRAAGDIADLFGALGAIVYTAAGFSVEMGSEIIEQAYIEAFDAAYNILRVEKDVLCIIANALETGPIDKEFVCWLINRAHAARPDPGAENC